MRKIPVYYLLLLIALPYSTRLVAQINILDSAFNKNGVISSKFETANSITTDKNRKILVLGHDRQSDTKNIFVTRYNADGSIDSTFGENGIFVFDLNDDYDYGRCIKALNNGKYVISGQNSTGPYFRGFILQINNNGTIDSSFGDTGVCMLPHHQENADAWAFKVAASGSIYIAGYKGNNGLLQAVFWKVKPSGNIDSSFGTNGEALIPGGNLSERFFGIDILTSSNAIVAVGTSDNGSDISGLVAMIDTSGKLETTFNNFGYKRILNNSASTQLRDVILTPQQIIIVGQYYGSVTNPVIISLLWNGSLNTNFISGGIATEKEVNANNICIVKACFNYFYIGGAIQIDNKYQFRLIKINASGERDSTFADNGQFSMRINKDYGEQVEAMTLFNNNRIFLSGRINNGNVLTTSGIVKVKIEGCENNSSLQSVVKQQHALIYPNPIKSGESHTLKLLNLSSGNTEIKIMNTTGIVLFRSVIDAASDSIEITPAYAFKPGYYLVSIANGGHHSTIKLIVE